MAEIEVVEAATTDEEGRPRLQGVSIRVEDGEIVVLLGDRESGARDLARALLGDQPLARGEVRVQGRRVKLEPAAIPADPGRDLDAGVSGWDVIAQPLWRSGLSRAEVARRIREAAEVMGIAAVVHRPLGALSAGQRQRVRLARAMVREPAAVLLPEALTGPGVATTLSEVVRASRTLGATTVVVQSALDALHPVDRVAVFEAGTIRQHGAPKAIYDRPADLYTAARWGPRSLALAGAQRLGDRLVTDMGVVVLPRGAAKLLEARPIVAGVRPGALAAGAGGGGLRLRGRVTGVAPGGAEIALQPARRDRAAREAGLDPRRVGRVRVEGRVGPGGDVELEVDPRQLLLFDADTGKNLLGARVLGDLGEPTVPPEGSAARERIVVREPDGRGPPGGPPDEPPGGGPPGEPPGTRGRRGPEPATVQRYLRCERPPKVGLDATFAVRVRVTVDAPTGFGSAFRTDAIPPQGADLHVVLHAPTGFTALNDAFRTLHLPPLSDSGPEWFQVRAPKQPGHHKLVVTVLRGNVELVQQSIPVQVRPGPVEPMAEVSAPLADAQEQPGQALLMVTRLSDKVYQYILLRHGHEHFVSKNPPYDFAPAARLKKLSAQLSEMAAGKGPSPSELPDALANLGRELWSSFIFPEVHEQLAALDVGAETLVVDAQDDKAVVPWELLYPVDAIGGQLDFLACLFPTVRSTSRNGRTLREQFSLRQAEFVVPDPEELPDALKEVTEIRRILGQEDRRPPYIREKPKLVEVLRDGGFGLLHVACHNSYGADAALLLAADKLFEPWDLNEFKRDGGAWAADAPLVFLNACGTSQPHRSFTSFRSWSQRFFEAGAGAFIGSMWDVRSSSARVFAAEFYRAFAKEQQPLAQAASAARQATREATKNRDPTWLAYAVHGSPSAAVADGGEVS
jgi:ABC-type sugar transport system ATPase subunit